MDDHPKRTYRPATHPIILPLDSPDKILRLYAPTLYAAEDVMYTLFELDEHYPGTRPYEVTDTTEPDFPENHIAVNFRYRLPDEFLKEWQLRKKQLRDGEITKEEYQERKLNRPQTADCCGRYEPKKK